MGNEDQPYKMLCHQVMSSDERDNNVVDKVDEFVFLGSSVPSVEADVKRRTRLAAWAFGRLRNTIWSNQDISRSLKISIYKALILPIATYGAETWTLRQADRCRPWYLWDEMPPSHPRGSSNGQSKEWGDQAQTQHHKHHLWRYREMAPEVVWDM